MDWAIEKGFGLDVDKFAVEDQGQMEADSNLISSKSKERGVEQIGSLGSGNHFLEIQRVDKIFDEEAAKVFGIEENQVTVMIHTGSRGLGHQVCTEALQNVDHAMHSEGKTAPDRELGYVDSGSKAADKYLGQMRAAANFAFVNRHVIMHWTRESFNQVLGLQPDELNVIYNVAHNILKVEEHEIDGKMMTVNVHRKGATRAFPPGHPLIPEKYRDIGQPVLIPGSMGTASYLCIGQPKAMELSFGSTASRVGPRNGPEKAINSFRGNQIKSELETRGISVKAASMKVLAEEAPGAYKDIDQVVNVSHSLGIIKKVARLVPIGVAKG